MMRPPAYTSLPERMYAAQRPSAVPAPRLIAYNQPLADALGLSLTLDEMAGNAIPDGAQPIAQAYAAHQFGQWNPMLGDGRAVLLGEAGGRDIVLKGAGRTPFSRQGDGRAALGPVLREYLVSEAMAALGIPTTRALAALETGAKVQREMPLPGAILVRVAASHIRIGTFQFFAAHRDTEALGALFEHACDLHYPGAQNPMDFLHGVMAAQADLVAAWMGVGFIHGVMNTDNMSVSGETIDFGPCAFMDGYNPGAVFSSIDTYGRYAYGNQPGIAHWNVAQLASCLMQLMPDPDAAKAQMQAAIDTFPALYEAAWLRVFGAKLGLKLTLETRPIAARLLDLMATDGADFTNTFANLPDARDQFLDREAFDAWQRDWLALGPDLGALKNPQVIPRNHRIESAIYDAMAGDFAPFHALLDAVTHPFDPNTEYARPPTEDERITRTYCGT
ncbi:conserved hypothetical protein [Ketogulonicigenium vulgare Y25]|uniref:Protein nucleotidyltransferase YdiU n=1 Tax=Ketogulonicigenium vulgare (strain WSH-001) TaxID=759362 RepID=F9Y478_KETVW|nr:YdiU family protein [Ketogulonicigenium vulgare]ADO42320.1 conserved hypothetical protein [Ketogulonicigenium vulgare Y25]AEM40514.1 Gluconate permease [Ketogulonicigenium vulgare WSH-001]ALJ80699.1 hypothetical protein KVH_05590 [Ketogulonicigenium vulgare]